MRFIQFLVTFALVTVRAAASPTVLSNPELPTEGAEALSSILAPHDPNKAATTSVSSDQSSATQQIHANNSESTVPPVTTGQPAPDLPSLSIPELPISSGSQTAQHSEPTLNVLSSSSTEKQPIEYTSTTTSDSTTSSAADSPNIPSSFSNILSSFSSGDGLGSIEKDFDQLTKGIENLLNPNFLNEVTSVFKYLSTALAPPVDTSARTLVANANDVLTADNAKKLIGLVDTANNSLTSSFVDKIEGLVDNANNLLTSSFAQKVDTLIDNANDLLTSDLVKKVDTLLDDASQLLTKKDFEMIMGLIENANNLLTPGFVNTTGGIITEAGPLISQASNLLTASNTKEIEALLSNAKYSAHPWICQYHIEPC